MAADRQKTADRRASIMDPELIAPKRVGSLGLALIAAHVHAVAGQPPKLPTPCLISNCGTSAHSFVQAGSGNAGAAVNGSTLTVTQSTSKVILNWADFNIANGYSVNFVQPSTTAAVLNKIWSADPSTIAGNLTANGQVYLYNQNGIVFTQGAQINVGGLVASSLGLSDSLFENGILSGNTSGGVPNPAFTAAGPGMPGAVTVGAGATLAAADGGRIMLLGSAVSNAGQITTPDGQTILAAGSQAVYLAASTDPSLRGLLVEVNAGGTTGTVTNTGNVSAPRGNVTLAGLIVNQSGMVSATTSVGENGSIYLVAGDTAPGATYYNPSPQENGKPTAFGGLLPTNGGTLILAPGSVTEVLPDSTDTGTLTGAQQASFIPSEVDLAGKAITLSGNATIRAPGGAANFYAAANPFNLNSSPSAPALDGGSIYLDNSSVIDVSGLSQVSAPVTQNLLQVTLETNDLQNDPLLRNGFLHGTTVTVDVNSPPSLFDITPYENNIAIGIDQLLTTAGSIRLNATGDVIARAGSTLNVSGGSIAYQGAYGAATTNLLAANGQVYNISNAPSTIQYVSVANSYSYTDPTWGITNKGGAQSYYAGYLQGKNAGSLSVEAPSIYLRGAMLAATVDGVYQRTPSSLAEGGSLILGCSNCVSLGNTKLPNFGLDGGVTFTNSIPSDSLDANIVSNGSPISATNLPQDSLLSPSQLSASGFGSIDVYSNGAIAFPVGASLTLPAGGNLILKSGQSLDFAGVISGPGASVSMQTVDGSGDGLSHDIIVGAGAIIDTSGSWINDSPSVTFQPGTTPTQINGGSVSLSAVGSVSIGIDSLIDVSGGGWINNKNKLAEGTAGKVALAASYSPISTSATFSPFTGEVVLGDASRLLGASLSPTGGGSLSIQSGSVTVGQTASGTPGELLINPGFLQQGGFASYSITGKNDVILGNLSDTADGSPITIAPLQETLQFTQNSLLRPTGTALSSFTQLTELPAALRSAASVSFAANASYNNPAVDVGDVTLARDASIVTDPGAAVTLAANGFNGSIRVYGSIDAPAGKITLSTENPAVSGGIQTGQDPGYIANQQILLGPDAVLSATAQPVINPENPLGYAEGTVLAGGTVSLNAYKGYVVTDPGSVIDVSGTAALIDVVHTGGVTPILVAGNAGTISIGAREGMVLQGSLIGTAATADGSAIAGAAAGTLNLDLGLNYDYSQFSVGNLGGITYPTNPRVLTFVGVDATGRPVGPFSLQLQSGSANINASTIMSGGFENVLAESSDTIAFAGSVALHAGASVTLDAPLFQAAPGAGVNISAPYVALGNYFNNSNYFGGTAPSPNAAAVLAAAAGTGALNVSAQLIDIRGISGWSGFGTESFSSSGDIRLVAEQNVLSNAPSLGVTDNTAFEGAFITSAALQLQAAQVYPTTATGFAINDLPVDGSLTPTVVSISAASGAAAPATPLSAEGSLSISATDIVQGGILRAPLGSLALNAVSIVDANGQVLTPGGVTLATGSLTSVSAEGLTIPYGATANGTQWTYSPGSGITTAISSLPPKQVTLTGAAVSINSGAKVDLSGGGDAYAYEFIAGQGGSLDVLDPTNLLAANNPTGKTVYTYAILPSLGSLFAPVDPQYSQGSGATMGQTITLSGVPGLASGTYALLPARYALLPGAFAIQIVKSDSGITVGSSVAQGNGAYVVAGRLGNASAGVVDSLTSTVLVAPDATVRNQSQYTDTYANAFFYGNATSGATQGSSSTATAASSLPADAGQLILAATSNLSLNGSLALAPGSFVSGLDTNGKPVTVQGRGGDVAITGEDLLVVDSAAANAPAAPGVLQLDVQQLDNLDAQTLILGAVASNTTTGEQLNLGTAGTGSTQTVELRNTTPLTASEIILAAQDNVTVDAGARIDAPTSATAAPGGGTLVLPGGGALLRVSSGPADLLSTGTLPQTPTGTVAIGAGAEVQASGSLLLYGADTTSLLPGAQINAPAVSLYSSVVSLGAVPTGTAGLVLNPQVLANLQGLTDLTIGSASTINLYGAVQLGTSASGTGALSSISFDSGGIGGYGAGDKTFEAGSIVLTNSNGTAATFTVPPDGTGALQFVADAGTSTATAQITLGSGAKSVSGFSALDLTAAGDLLLEGTGALNVGSAAPVNLTGVAIVGAAGSNQSITTGGAVSVAAVTASSARTVPAGLGATLALTGGSIQQGGTIDLPAGSITLAGTGGVTLEAGSVTAAPGASQNFSVQQAAANGGLVDLTSSGGDVTIASGATVDVSAVSTAAGAGNSGSGTLEVSAPAGSLSVASGALKGAAAVGQTSGSFVLDVGTGLGGGGLASLESILGSSGFQGSINLRSRADSSVALTGSVAASSFTLSVDQGSIDVASSAVINTSGGKTTETDAGPIDLWAGTGLTMESGAQLLANAGGPGPMGANGAYLASRAGNVMLGTSSGQMVLSGGLISMQGGGDASTDGTLTLRAPRTANDANVQLTVQSGLNVQSRNAVVVEGFERYTADALSAGPDAGCNAGGACDVADTQGMLFTDAQSFMQSMATLPANLSGLTSVQVRPGIEIDSAAGGNQDIALNQTWDLASWNAALGTPVNLTVRAGGNLVLGASLSDGFTATGAAVSTWSFGEPTGAGTGSASYRLTGGADLSAADPLAVVAQAAATNSLGAPPNSGNVILAPGAVVRTGTGSIDIAAGGDVLLGYLDGGYDANGHLLTTEVDPLSAVIYTAGTPSLLSATQSAAFTPSTLGRGAGTGAAPAYPTDGGDVNVSAAVDIRSATSSQYVTDWLWRRGAASAATPGTSSSWWVMFNQFEQGVGALGGGNVSLSAGRDIINTSAVVPTTGRLLVGADAGNLQASDLLLTGGGNLNVTAGGNIASGVYEDDWGSALIRAGGSIGSGTDSTFGQQYPTAPTNVSLPAAATQIYPVLVVGNGTFGVDATSGIELGGVTNSTTLPMTLLNSGAIPKGVLSSFFAYAPDSNPSTLNIVDTAKSVTLQADALADNPVVAFAPYRLNYSQSGPATGFLATYPSTVNVAALSGDIDLGDATLAKLLPNAVNITLFPGASGNLNLLANGSINNNGTDYTIQVSEANPTAVPTVLNPLAVAGFPGISAAATPLVPLHQGDPSLITVVAASGSIDSGNFVFPKASDILAAGNLTDVSFSGKNLNPSDVSLVEAGGNIAYSTPTDPVTNQLSSVANNKGISVAGPGAAVVLAGGSIDLGDGSGVVTSGSLTDSRLQSNGADIIVGAGLGTNADGTLRLPATRAFINAYLAPTATLAQGQYGSTLVAYMQRIYPVADAGISYPAALSGFESLTYAQQLPLLSSVLMDELSATGLAHNASGTNYDRGYQAINTLFPVTDAQGKTINYRGDLNMFYSQLKTQQGGNIFTLVPGGSVIVGVPNPPADLLSVKGFDTASGVLIPGTVNLGILALAQGAIEGFAGQDFDVNQSRILTLEGGDVILWASNGSIDAGKGAKSASGAPPPTIQTDASGNLFVDPANTVSGSGIGQLLTVPGLKAGLVNLIAPRGVVNAGDAGIRVAGNLNIAAVQVIGASNITVVGTSSGVPVSSAGAFAGALSGANSLGDASKSALDQLNQDIGSATNYQTLTDGLAPTFIIVKMFCLGIECETP